MSTDSHARRASVRVSIDGHDATAYIAPSLLDFSYTDNLSGKADEVQLTLQDREARWNGPWKPQKGMQVVASLTVLDWFAQGEEATLHCGSFKIDEITLDGPPDAFKIKAVSASLTSGLRDEHKTRAWENQNLQGIAAQLAGEHGLELHYEGGGKGEETHMVRQDQREEADLPFLHRLANERAMHCKVHDGKLILADSIKAEQQKPAVTLRRVGTDTPVTRYSFKQSSAGTAYTKAEAAYTDPSTGQVHTATAQVESESQNADPKTMQLNTRVESSSAAMRLAGSALHNANKSEDTASVDCMGHPGLVAGLSIQLAGFGDFSGSYLIEKATHKLGSSGYTTALELRKCRLSPDLRMTSGSVPVAKNIPAKKPQPPVNPTEKWEAEFERYKDFWLQLELSSVTKLLLCLPDIAAAEAGKASQSGPSNDAQGWWYLRSMFHHWFSAEPANTADTCKEPFWVEWDWVMSFDRAAASYLLFTDPAMIDRPHVINHLACMQLGEILRRNKLLQGKTVEFDFTRSVWTEWEDKYHTLMSVPRIPAVDGLMAAMAGFTLRALAGGYAKPRPQGGHTIHVNKVSVFVHDKFNFEEDDGVLANDLWYWNCDKLSFSAEKQDEYTNLENSIFRIFRQKYNRGGDFLVLSQPHTVENFQGVTYVYP